MARAFALSVRPRTPQAAPRARERSRKFGTSGSGRSRSPASNAASSAATSLIGVPPVAMMARGEGVEQPPRDRRRARRAQGALRLCWPSRSGQRRGGRHAETGDLVRRRDLRDSELRRDDDLRAGGGEDRHRHDLDRRGLDPRRDHAPRLPRRQDGEGAAGHGHHADRRPHAGDGRDDGDDDDAAHRRALHHGLRYVRATGHRGLARHPPSRARSHARASTSRWSGARSAGSR